MFEPRVIQVIEYKELRGKGTDADPYRRVTIYCDFDGKVLAEEPDIQPPKINPVRGLI